MVLCSSTSYGLETYILMFQNNLVMTQVILTVEDMKMHPILNSVSYIKNESLSAVSELHLKRKNSP
jgi:hypothetical protein